MGINETEIIDETVNAVRDKGISLSSDADNAGKFVNNQKAKLSKKVKIIVAAIIGFVLLAILIFIGTTSSGKPLTVSELLDVAERYLLERNYEQALVEFIRVIEVDPMEPRGYTGAADAYVGQDKLEDALDILEQGLIALPDNPVIKTQKEIILRLLCKHTWLDASCIIPMTCAKCDATEGDTVEHIWIEATLFEPKTCEVCRLTEGEPIPGPDIPDEIRDFLLELLELYRSGGYESIHEIVGSEVFREILDKIEVDPLILFYDSINYGIGVYGGWLYIGEYVENQRRGKGIWLWNEIYRYEGEWLNDKPNGTGIITWRFTYPNFTEDHPDTYGVSSATGTLVDGLWHGSVTYDIDGVELTVEKINGMIVPVDFERIDIIDLEGEATPVKIWGEIPEYNDDLLYAIRVGEAERQGGGTFTDPDTGRVIAVGTAIRVYRVAVWRLDGTYGVYTFADYSRTGNWVF